MSTLGLSSSWVMMTFLIRIIRCLARVFILAMNVVESSVFGKVSDRLGRQHEFGGCGQRLFKQFSHFVRNGLWTLMERQN